MVFSQANHAGKRPQSEQQNLRAKQAWTKAPLTGVPYCKPLKLAATT